MFGPNLSHPAWCAGVSPSVLQVSTCGSVPRTTPAAPVRWRRRWPSRASGTSSKPWRRTASSFWPRSPRGTAGLTVRQKLLFHYLSFNWLVVVALNSGRNGSHLVIASPGSMMTAQVSDQRVRRDTNAPKREVNVTLAELYQVRHASSRFLYRHLGQWHVLARYYWASAHSLHTRLRAARRNHVNLQIKHSFGSASFPHRSSLRSALHPAPSMTSSALDVSAPPQDPPKREKKPHSHLTDPRERDWCSVPFKGNPPRQLSRLRCREFRPRRLTFPPPLLVYIMYMMNHVKAGKEWETPSESWGRE